VGSLILIGGGVRSGKSGFAHRLALRLGDRRAYIATAEARDEEMRARIERHRAERGDAFATVEEPIELARALAGAEGAEVVVVDCLTLWLSNLLGAGESDDRILARVDQVVGAVAGGSATAIVVTNEVGMGVVPPSELGRRFRDVAGFAHQRLSAAADEIYWAVLGTILRVRPSALEVR